MCFSYFVLLLLGNALSALGRKEEALHVWEQGYQNAVSDLTDLKQLVELEELLGSAKECQSFNCEDHAMDTISCETKVVVSEDQAVDSLSTDMSIAETKAIISEDGDSTSVTKVVISEDHVRDSLLQKTSTTEAEHVNSSTSTVTDKKLVNGHKSDTSVVELKLDDSMGILSIYNETAKTGRKVFVTGLPKTKSISLDFRLSRGIAQVCFGLNAVFY